MTENPHLLQFNVTDDTGNVTSHKLSHKLVTNNKIEPNRSHLILYDEEFVFQLDDSQIFYVDATFDIVPRIKGKNKQFLTVMVESYEHVIKLILIITAYIEKDEHFEMDFFSFLNFNRFKIFNFPAFKLTIFHEN